MLELDVPLLLGGGGILFEFPVEVLRVLTGGWPGGGGARLCRTAGLGGGEGAEYVTASET